jgi:LPPG:FO 2-phospho-L-lactate transferase
VQAYGLELTILPMSHERIRTRVLTPAGPLAFQDYFVRRRTTGDVLGIELDGIATAQPSPGVITAIQDAEAILIAPSNPFVSVGPILALPGVRDALRARRDRCIAISPIVGGETIKGPAARKMQSRGYENSAWQVADLYKEFIAALVIDGVDASLASRVERSGVRAVVTDTIMHGIYEKAALARTVLRSVRGG